MAPDSRAILRRLTGEYSAAAWRVICVRVLAEAVHDESDAAVRTPAHYLAAAWSPATRPPSRWPEAVVIGSPTSERTLSELALRLPGDGMLWLADADQLDAGLAADILLASDRNLEPYQRAAVAAFAQAELERTRRTIVAVYSDIDPGFERFRASLVPPSAADDPGPPG